MNQVCIGVDVHKRSHTCVAVDSNGRRLGRKTVDSTRKGHTAAMRWAAVEFGSVVTWGVEDVRGLSAGLERDLLAAGQRVVRVPPHLTARERASSRTPGKSDPIDALAVARAVLREPDLPAAFHDGPSMDVKLLIDRREELVGMRMALSNRVLGRLHIIDPTPRAKKPVLTRASHRLSIEGVFARHPGVQSDVARDELDDITRVCEQIKHLTERIEERITVLAPSLLALTGCGVLTAARLVAESANITRFSNEAKFAAWGGLAPTPQMSGRADGRVVRSRGGNRRINTTLHIIALSQIRQGGSGAQYYRRRIARGDTHGRALACLKRHICRTVYRRMLLDYQSRHDGIVERSKVL